MDTSMVEITHGRHNPLIDPGLTIWGWEIPVYLFLGGVVAGMMILLALMELRSGHRPRSVASQLMPAVAVALLSLGMGTLFLDLEHKLHVLRFYTTFEPTSPMSWGSWILLLVYPILLLQLLGGMGEGLRAATRALLGQRLGGGLLAFADAHRRGVLIAAMAVGAGLGIYTGLLLGTMHARLQWSSAALGPLFLTSGLSTGAALLLLFPLHKDEAQALVRWDSIAIVVEMLLIGVMLLGLVTDGGPARMAARNLLGGPWTPYFWSLVILAGLVTPLLLNLLEMRAHLKATFVAPALVLLGGLALRWIIVAAGQATNFDLIP